MKKTTFYIPLIMLLFLLMNSVYPHSKEEKMIRDNFGWLDRSYSPELFLQPYFNLDLSSFFKAANAHNIIFSDDFEGTTPKWTFVNSPDNAWYIGTVVNNGGTKSMYISDDSGLTNNYSGDSSISYAVSEDIDIPIGVNDVQLSFDWQTDGEARYDYLAVWMVPSTYVPQANAGITVSDSAGILIKGNLNGQMTFTRSNYLVDVSQLTTKKVKIIFQWENDNLYFFQPPAAVDNVELVWNSCSLAKQLPTTNITATGATVNWIASTGTNTGYELFISSTDSQPANSDVGILVNNTTTSYNFTALNAGRKYYVWIRTICSATEKGFWSEYIFFTTLCGVSQTPYWEGFNKDSDLSCWTIIDSNGDAELPTSPNTWKVSSNSFEGNQSMYFYGDNYTTSKLPHNDWLISPPITLSKDKKYRLKYHYLTSTEKSFDYEFEVLMSTTGSDNTNKFTQIIVPKKKYDPSSAWIEEYVFFDGVDANINLAWHVTGNTIGMYLYLDNIKVEEVMGCPEPIDLGVKNITDVNATLFWTDNFGATNWEYYVQKVGNTMPTATNTGLTANTKEITVNKEFNGSNLVENTKYEYYVRTVCSTGGYSIWQGPFLFNTACTPFTVPFAEGFNTDSPTKDCWIVLNNNNDSNRWTESTTHQEGTHSMYFTGSAANAPHDDWLVSPGIKLDSLKTYKLTYFYRSSALNNNNFEVLLSEKGIAVTDFTKVLATRTHNESIWKKDVLILGGIQGSVHIAWRVNTPASATSLYIDDVRIEEVTCVEPTNLGVKDVVSNQVTLFWEDNFNKNWEYVVQIKDSPAPTNPGAAVTVNQVVATTTNAGVAIQPDTEYEYYVRSKCANGDFSEWIGPIVFKTPCMVSLPYTESFESNSDFKTCWVILDENKDGNSSANIWRELPLSFNAHDGNISMYYYGSGSGKVHDDWLISPVIPMSATDIYELTYYYKSSTSNNNEFEVALSTNGPIASEFKQILVPKAIYKNDVYTKKTVYITNVSGEAQIGWHVLSTGTTYIYIDLVTVRKVDCVGPSDVKLTTATLNSATLEWNDNHNSDWEYYVQDLGGGVPVSSGTLTKTKNITVTRTSTSGGVNLTPNTGYHFYVRSNCAAGKYSDWIGPFYFKTLCAAAPLPFWEGFNRNSTTLDCWKIIDGNGDSVSANSNIWNVTTIAFEGNQSMRFSGSSTTALPHNDWLISPSFTLDPTKIYRLKYHLRTASSIAFDYEYAVLLSTTGTEPANFTVPVTAKKKYAPFSDWRVQTAFVSGIGGNVNIAWHVTSATSSTSVYIDNLFLEEVSCPEPIDLGSKDEKDNSATIFWEDKFGSDWEYVVQKAGGADPVGNGIATKNKEVIVDFDKNGNALVHNTDYEFFVRTMCGTNNISVWAGPYKFRTACGVFDTPLWEGFNESSKTLNCWTILDENKDATSPTSAGIWKVSSINYEGTRSMYFSGTAGNAPHNDWLISPKMKFETGKTYRLKYNYRTIIGADNNNEFEVVLSTKGINPSDFTTVVVPKRSYEGSSVWKQEYVFINNVSGDVNIAWHVTSATTGVNLYIDNVFIEEVKGCEEIFPDGAFSKDIGSDKATLFWNDVTAATTWEYYVQYSGAKAPKGAGVSTNNKENVVTTDATGSNLKPNTDYEFYVRTSCVSGGFSIWQGPFRFTTLCGIAATPYWEGFNTAEKTYRCWTIIDGNTDATSPTGNNIWKINTATTGVYEGNQSMYFSGQANRTHDDWLISPTLTVDGGMYVLKYHYRAAASNNNNLEVLLSTSGIEPKDFTTPIVASKVNKNAGFVEEVAFVNMTQGAVNLAWHVPSVGATTLYIDNITFKKVVNCPEPYHVKLTNEQSTSIDIEWSQDGNVTEWEILVVNYGDHETATPIKTMTVPGAEASATITGLDSGRVYSIFVRAKCAGGATYSDWSTPVTGVTAVAANNNCAGAITIPVNTDEICVKKVSGTFIGAETSVAEEPSCGPETVKRDIWFEFTATSDIHLLKLEDWKKRTGTGLYAIYGALYELPCSSIANIAVECFTISSGYRGKAFKNLTPGQKYYLRLGVNAPASIPPTEIFNLCITTPNYLEINPSGDKYTMEELVKEVLISSSCDLVSNVRYQNGDGSTQGFNTVGYFNRGKSDFPFDEGIVLSTNEIRYATGPAQALSFEFRGGNNQRWVGDRDINNAIADAGGAPPGSVNKRVTQLEFDFVSIKDSIKFEYLFASNSYHSDCTDVGCAAGALFAAWLVDTTTGDGINLAKIKGTDTPIALNTIMDANRTKKLCASSYPELYWKHYAEGADDRLEAYVDFVGLTMPMESETVSVVPGRLYHIKLAVIDFCTFVSHSSAVFFNAGSFDLGELDLGADLLVETGNAICSGESKTIKSELITDNVTINWYKDGVLIPGENKPDLEVRETGTYEIIARYDAINCEVSGSVKVEIYPPLSTVINAPTAFEVCRNSLVPIILNLSTKEAAMFAKVDRDNYDVTYYNDKTDAELEMNSIDTTYALNSAEGDRIIYVRVEDQEYGCSEIFEIPIVIRNGSAPALRENILVCASYTFPELEVNQYYYTGSAATGVQYQAGDVLVEPIKHTIYVLQDNGEGCYEEISYDITITASVKAVVFKDENLDCKLYQLLPLPENNKYYTQPGGQGEELTVGTHIPFTQKIYVYATSEDGLCTDESSFEISYTECPIPKGISPNGDGYNDSFDLSAHGVTNLVIYNRYGMEVYSFSGLYTNQWFGQDKKNKLLPDGTYFYVVISHGKTRSGWVQINK